MLTNERKGRTSETGQKDESQRPKDETSVPLIVDDEEDDTQKEEDHCFGNACQCLNRFGDRDVGLFLEVVVYVLRVNETVDRHGDDARQTEELGQDIGQVAHRDPDHRFRVSELVREARDDQRQEADHCSDDHRDKEDAHEPDKSFQQRDSRLLHDVVQHDDDRVIE